MTYLLDNAHAAAETRLRILERLYDCITRANLDAAGIGPNQDVWEVGAGGGSIAHWAAVERSARVVITDVDLRHLSPAAREQAVAVLCHDVAADPPPGLFDVIHLRLLASHLPAWPAVLPRLVDSLHPGGWLCVEDLDPMLPYAPGNRTPGDVLVNRVGRAFTAALASAGGDPRLGRRLSAELSGAELVDVATCGSILAGTGGGLIADLMTVNTTQLAPQLADAGITPADLDAYHAALRDRRQEITMPVFWAARGRRPR